VLQRPGGQLTARAEVQLRKDMGQVALHRALRQHECKGYFSIAQPARYQLSNFSFTGWQAARLIVDGVCAAGERNRLVIRRLTSISPSAYRRTELCTSAGMR